ncbi:disulfide isomerase DsbC N-terminal domain-containing protein [Aeromonas finlandensis]|uniref:disulfide isomerase DsbC N-terminal domain-containing protein n=1 Tax=Aeromonas finlandensis TaxID=1543375 RepID=UPI00067CCD13|nr:disulfide isomerase DsbC N-terminal domain-containing protein [Aeromonas finlandensis]
MDPQALKAAISTRLGIPVYMVDQTPITGLYMLGTSKGVLYSDAKGDYVVQGVMLDMTHDMKNLTISGMRSQRRLGLSQVAHAPLVIKASNERHRVALFLGEQDAARRQLPDTLQHLQASGVSVEVYPVIEHASQAADWCNDPLLQNDPFKAYLPQKACSETLIQNIGLSQWLGVKVLPAWVSSDGDLVRGYQSPEQLLKILDHIDAPANPSSSAS